ncbi:toll/interleukin-1 receptor domain-containing protein [Pseudomonas fluorescens]|uniref:toll/interleukin-1 receptor domain-containing protein n=1 Tax=Pseudomonas fluorescens TaxID=294 RepID=UPI001399711C|nr:toll/interleukin-1 receptor domain-containing protein [Pseudomonas fluorescens]QIA03840.1 TIR domain-containing protein [Pseudomonas fluorescens]
MARNVTKAELRAFTANRSKSGREQLLRSNASSGGTSTFLSHSSKDHELLEGAMEVLYNHGARVYIDEIDPEMPPYTSTETAALLKQRISQTRRFVLLTTENSKESRWVPWELGVADGEKSLVNIALFPASDSTYDDSWTSWEYLGLYQRIVWGKLSGHEKELWMVLDAKANTAVTLSNWLSGY